MNISSLTESHHGVFVSALGYGVLIIGKSTSGKSSLALELLHEGHKLVADDVVDFRFNDNNDIVGYCPKMLKNMLHHRELGILNVRKLFGEPASIEHHRLDYVVQLTDSYQELSVFTPAKSSYLVHAQPYPQLTLNQKNPASLSHRLTTWLQMQNIENSADELQRRQTIIMNQQ